jgi:hypothetical protein
MALLDRTQGSDFLHTLTQDEPLTRVMKALDLGMEEAALFLIVLAQNVESSRGIDLMDVRNHFEMTQKEYSRYLHHAVSLEKRNLLVFESDRSGFRNPINPRMLVDQGVFTVIVSGRDPFDDTDFSDIYAVTQLAMTLIQSRSEEKITEHNLFFEFERLWKRVPPGTKLYPLGNGYTSCEQMMLFQAIEVHIEGARSEEFSDFSRKIHASLSERARFISRTLNGSMRIFKDRVLKIYEEGGIRHDPSFCLSDRSVDALFPVEKKLKGDLRLHSPFLIRHDHKALGKRLFLGGETKKALDDLSVTLSHGQFRRTVNRLKDAGFPTGLAAIFHGGPGTGKTASAHVLAHVCKRDLLQVEISKIRDCWVGNSEKNMRQIFDDYRRACKEGRHAPILLFNEADALLSRRLSVMGSVDQMNNTMQNILLEELERFEGIFLATTNLLQNLDDAFSRRFLFKLEFAPPDRDARALIWQDKMPGLSPELCQSLAVHDLTGAQIENVARRCLLESALHGSEPTLTTLKPLLDSELGFKNSPNRRRIGFV